MRFLTVAVAVSAIAAASGQTARYPFKPDGPCVEACTIKVGTSLFPNFTHDENSPYWMESLSYDHDRSHPKYQEFMMNAGMCMGQCPVTETDIFRAQFQAKTEWYQKAKAEVEAGGNNSGNTNGNTGNSGNETGSGNEENGSVQPPSSKYPFKPDGPCVEACSIKTGKALFPNFSHDESSPYWMESLGYDHDRSHPKYQEFMMNAGMCMGACPASETDLFRAQFQAKIEWYQKNKGNTGNEGNGSGNAGDGSSSGGDGSGNGGDGSGNGDNGSGNSGDVSVKPPSSKYPFKPDGPCVEACSVKTGKALFPNFTHDENSPYWMESLGYDHDRSHPKYQEFMMNAGMCMGVCPASETDLFRAQFQAKIEWYQKNKGNTGNDGNGSSNGGDGSGNSGDGSVKPPSSKYPFKPDGPCVEACSIKAGKALFPNFSHDESSPYWMESLGYDHDRSHPKYQEFMMNAGMCMGACPASETDLFRAQFQAKIDWYQKNKGDTGNGGDGSGNGGNGSGSGGDGSIKPPSSKYPFKPDGPCVEACSVKTGKALFPNFTHDENSPYWMESLGYDHDRSHPKYQEFMMNAGMCMSACPASETDLFRAQFQAKIEWYQKNKGGTGNGGDGSGNGGDGSGNGGDGSVKPPSGKYPFKADGPCVEACTMKTGKALFPNFTHDQSSPYWMQSLAYDHDRSHPKYQEFMMNAGMCMGTCPASETDLFRAQFQAKADWYQKNKGGTGNGGDGSGNGGDGSGNGGDGSVKPPSGKYPFKADGPCVEACTMKTGKAIFPNFTHDQSSPYWMQSLAYDHDRSHPKYQEFMMNAGMCMGTCPASETDLFRAQFQAKTEWYQKNKGNTGNGGDGSGNGGDGSGNGGDGSGNGGDGSVKPPSGNYPFKPDGPCVESCTMKTGKTMLPNFTHDQSSPYWMQSLAYDHDRSHPKYQEFMMNAGMCMSACPASETDLFRAQFQAKTDWYQKNKGNTGNGGDGSGNGGNGSGNGGDGSGNGANGGDGSGNGGNSCNIDAASYSFKPDGACVEACTMTTGKAMFPNFTHDKTSPYWMESLGYDHDRSHPKYQEFMMNAGMCMGACPTEEADLFRAQFQAKTEWYQKAKTGGGNCGNGGDGSTGGSGGDGSNGGAGGLPATTGTLGNTISAAGATATSTGSAVVSPTGAPQNSASAVASGILSIAAALLSTVALL